MIALSYISCRTAPQQPFILRVTASFLRTCCWVWWECCCCCCWNEILVSFRSIAFGSYHHIGLVLSTRNKQVRNETKRTRALSQGPCCSNTAGSPIHWHSLPVSYIPTIQYHTIQFIQYNTIQPPPSSINHQSSLSSCRGKKQWNEPADCIVRP